MTLPRLGPSTLTRAHPAGPVLSHEHDRRVGIASRSGAATSKTPCADVLQLTDSLAQFALHLRPGRISKGHTQADRRTKGHSHLPAAIPTPPTTVKPQLCCIERTS